MRGLNTRSEGYVGGSRAVWSTALLKLRCLNWACLMLGLSLQTSLSESPTKPRSDLARFAWMIGDWDTTATYRFIPEAPSSNAHSTEKVRWAVNQHFIVSEEEGSLPDGWHGKLIITGWNEKETATR